MLPINPSPLSPLAMLVNLLSAPVEILPPLPINQMFIGTKAEDSTYPVNANNQELVKVVMPGCSFCRKDFGTVEQFKRHITEDVQV